jgi:signal transduction histidine kinase
MARTVEKARLYERLAEREEMLEDFAARTVEAQELERRRLAGEIHDGISQRLISLWYHLEAAADSSGDSAVLDRELSAARELATGALNEARTAITGLRPSVLDDLGLGPSLESLARSSGNLKVSVQVEPVELPGHVEMALYRIAQEALQNVLKHAEASSVRVALEVGDDGVRLVVADDGRGFTQESVADAEGRHSYGMVGMRERAALIGAQLSVFSKPGKGTTLEVLVPRRQSSAGQTPAVSISRL